MTRRNLVYGLMVALVASSACWGKGSPWPAPRELATRPAGKRPRPAPVVSGDDRKFVQDTLAGVGADKPDTAEKATAALVDKGETIIPAMKEALAGANESGREVIEAALAKLDWKLDPARLITDWAQARNKDLKKIPAPAPLANALTTSVLPNWRFYLVAYRAYPVAMMPPAPLRGRQVFILGKDGKLECAADTDALKKFFRANLPPVKEDKDAKAAVAAWLQVSKELSSDGWFRFKIAPEDIKTTKTDNGLEATGKAAVEAGGGPRGNQGAIAVTITFDEQGKVTNIDQVANLRPGMRPICQSTKLLDRDEIVRKMAEQDLLMMGTSAREYLIEQRATATPELQKAIDAIWQKILDCEREDRNVDPRLK